MAETPLSGSLGSYATGLEKSYRQTCRNSAMFRLTDTPDQQILILFCTSYFANPAQGEIAVMHFRKIGDLLVRNFYHKRGDAFVLAETKSGNLPLSDIELQQTIARISSFRVTRPIAD